MKPRIQCGRIAYQSRFGPAVLPVNYKWHGGAVVFRTTRHSALDEDLQTGIAGGDYLVAFESTRSMRSGARAGAC
jgi:Pyridoxamine 5'-phosphate oxidase